MEKHEPDGIPSELKERLGGFDDAISKVESMLQPLLSVSHSDLEEKLGPLDCAKLDLVGVYSINSLFWMYLNVCGVNPKDHPVKTELERIRSYMSRVKEAQDSLLKPRLNQQAAKRFVTSALWQEAHKKAKTRATTEREATVKEAIESQAKEAGHPSLPDQDEDEDQVTMPPSGKKKKRKRKH